MLCAASGRSLVQRSPTNCGVSVCDREVSIMRKPCPAKGCCAVAGVCVCDDIKYGTKVLKLLRFAQIG